MFYGQNRMANPASKNHCRDNEIADYNFVLWEWLQGFMAHDISTCSSVDVDFFIKTESPSRG